MIVTLINPSPSKGKRFIQSKRPRGSGSKRSRKEQTKEKVMAKFPIGLATRFKAKRRKVSRKRKMFSFGKALKATTFVRGSKRRRKGAHRPVVIWTGTKFRRPLRSRLFPRPTRINPRKRSYRRYRRNPLLPRLPMGIDRSLMAGLPVAGGIAISMFAMPQIARFMPASFAKQSRYFGVVHIALGIAAMAFVKQNVVKTVGGTVLAMGIYDLIACNVKALKLPPLPGRDPAVLGASYGAEEIVGASYAPEIGTDYAPAIMGASYGDGVGDDIDYGSDSIEIG